ncbi:C-type lectin domain family 4 member G [Oryzias melastigma]|uniref:C-type lectin domain family 4 member G n=1 Tax=Oryzias melastigma TaxID=30732 RepID=UPI000CF7D832|nr:C-type lectin domain family 4 member G [Oryzias melastigma]
MSNNRYEEDGSDWVEKEVAIYGTSNDFEDYYTFQPTRKGSKTPRCSPVQKESKTLLRLKVLCVLMAAGILILSICCLLLTLENNKRKNCHNQLQTDPSDHLMSLENNDMNNTSNQLQTEISVMLANNRRLQNETKQLKDKNEVMRINNRRLQDDVKNLKLRIEGLKRSKCPDGWERFGCSCYYKSTKKASWTDGRSFCLQEGSDLVVINSVEEQNFLAKLNQKGESWIGLYLGWSSQKENYVRIWVDGLSSTEICWESEKTPYPFQSHIAVFLNAEGRMAELDKNDSKNYICEM